MNTINPINQNSKYNTQFKGIIPQNAMRQRAALDIANVLSQDSADMLKLTKFISDKRFNFLENLAEKYNRLNFALPRSQKDDATLVNQVFAKIKKPGTQHIDLIMDYPGNFKVLAETLLKVGNSKKTAKFVNKVIKEIYGKEKEMPQKIIPELLNSEHSKKYINDFNKYKPYLLLYKDNLNVVKNLDELVSQNKYNKSKYNKILNFENLKKEYSYVDTAFFNREFYAAQANEYRTDLLSDINTRFFVTEEMMRNGNDKDLANIYKTTSKSNYKLRSQIVNNFCIQESGTLSKKGTTKDLENLKNLFNMLDNDKQARKFVKALIKDSQTTHHFHRVASVVDILNNISSKKLNAYIKNAIYIMNTSSQQKRLGNMEKELDNPVLRYNQDETNILLKNINKFHLNFEHLINTIKYRILVGNKNNKITNTEEANKVIPEKLETMLNSKVESQTITKDTKPNENIINKKEQQVKPQTYNPFPQRKGFNVNGMQIDQKRLINQQAWLNKNPKTFDKIKKIYNSTIRFIKKQETQNNILDITRQKLGTKTFNNQKDIFKQNANKIRLSLLPEMFASIIDTRKVDRAIGKKHNVSANKDVLQLYLVTNGKNKKLINYMLKKRNVDNTRMFEVKDIINEITQAEKKITKAQKENPAYKANDARKYYNHLYEAKIEQYGKLKRQNKINKKV